MCKVLARREILSSSRFPVSKLTCAAISAASMGCNMIETAADPALSEHVRLWLSVLLGPAVTALGFTLIYKQLQISARQAEAASKQLFALSRRSQARDCAGH